LHLTRLDSKIAEQRGRSVLQQFNRERGNMQDRQALGSRPPSVPGASGRGLHPPAASKIPLPAPTELTFRSPRDGAQLTLSVKRRIRGETMFEVQVETDAFSGRIGTSTYRVGSPSAMFQAMAMEWHGWAGQKSWVDVEGRTAFTATADASGHVILQVVLKVGGACNDLLKVNLDFDAAQLDAMASEIEELLG
jgi:hypothetical protein